MCNKIDVLNYDEYIVFRFNLSTIGLLKSEYKFIENKNVNFRGNCKFEIFRLKSKIQWLE